MGTSEGSARYRAHGALAVASRVRLLDTLRGLDRALDARELADACGLHISTVRFHLDVLRQAGLVRSDPDPARRRGRPRLLFSPASGVAAGAHGHSNYQLLATALATHWAGTPAQRSRRAEDAGYAMAATQLLATPPRTAPTMEEAVTGLSAMFTELGFDPEVVRDGDVRQLLLHACPFRAVALESPDVICSLHLGLLRGALAEMRAPAIADGLAPFVETHLCVARISPAAPPTSNRPATRTVHPR